MFFRRNWSIVYQELLSAVQRVLDGDPIPPNMSDALIVLIPKVSNPTSVNQLRPISLLNVAFKIAMKTMVARLKPVMSTIIFTTQSSFVPGRQITDNIIITQEMMHSLKDPDRPQFMMIKIDLEKAYDRIRWSFIRDTLHEARLPSFLIKSIMNSIMS